MPNSCTFSAKPIGEFVHDYIDVLTDDAVSIDPYARDSALARLTNDIDPASAAQSHMDAVDFMRTFADGSVDLLLFDPPYSPRQVSECYRGLGIKTDMQTTQASYWSRAKTEAGRIIKSGGVALSFGWNSNGMGKKNGFAIERILLVAHGGAHNDTICVAERKL